MNNISQTNVFDTFPPVPQTYSQNPYIVPKTHLKINITLTVYVTIRRVAGDNCQPADFCYGIIIFPYRQEGYTRYGF